MPTREDQTGPFAETTDGGGLILRLDPDERTRITGLLDKTALHVPPGYLDFRERRLLETLLREVRTA